MKKRSVSRYLIQRVLGYYNGHGLHSDKYFCLLQGVSGMQLNHVVLALKSCLEPHEFPEKGGSIPLHACGTRW